MHVEFINISRKRFQGKLNVNLISFVTVWRNDESREEFINHLLLVLRNSIQTFGSLSINFFLCVLFQFIFIVSDEFILVFFLSISLLFSIFKVIDLYLHICNQFVNEFIWENLSQLGDRIDLLFLFFLTFPLNRSISRPCLNNNLLI
jgi:hypothetical protein